MIKITGDHRFTKYDMYCKIKIKIMVP